ncbi:hypothetical protein H1C71_000020 [Ictidomys tridecemlineatus]|nr:hypothetical protein H1C71_000020 [Ictidomys tridecemlineatus]
MASPSPAVSELLFLSSSPSSMITHMMQAAEENVSSFSAHPWDPSTCQRLCAFRWSRAPPGGQHYILKNFLGPKSATQALPRCGKSAPLQKASAATSHPVMPGCEPYIKVSWA